MISKLTSGKNEKPRRGVYIKKLQLDLLFVFRKDQIESKAIEYADKWIFS